MKTVGFTLLIAVKQRAGESFGQGGGEEQRTAVERREDPVLQFAVQRAAGIDLLIFFHQRALIAGRGSPVNPVGLLQLRAKIVNFLWAENGGDMVHHRCFSSRNGASPPRRGLEMHVGGQQESTRFAWMITVAALVD